MLCDVCEASRVIVLPADALSRRPVSDSMSDKLQRILLLTNELSFRGSSILTLRLARELEARGIETATLCTRQGPMDLELTGGLKILQLSGYSLPMWGRVVGRTVLSQLQPQPPDIIHAQCVDMYSQALRLGQALDCPIVLSVGDQAEAARVASCKGIEHCRAIVCVSDSVRDAIPADLRLERIERRVVLPGVCIPDESTIQPILPDDREPVIGMAGPLEILKGGSFFLRACHRVIEKGHDIRVVITGSGPEERNLRRLATSLELGERLTFVDDGAEMRAYLSAIDIFCLPSLQQGLGVMMLEAMALGRPVIASGVGGILSVISDSSTGLIVPPSDSRAIAEKILTLLEDKNYARQIAAAGRQLVETHFSIKRSVDEMIALYQEVFTGGDQRSAVVSISGQKDSAS
jgi:glycosyltransferase involved in cell wall biosynthesis